MGALSQRIIAKVSGPAWDRFAGSSCRWRSCSWLFRPTPTASSSTTYVKFTIDSDPKSHVFAAIWLKSSKRLIVGLALPEEYEAEELGPSLPGTRYKGLTKYFVVERGGVVPKGLAEWAGLAYQNALSAEPLTGFVDQLAAKKKSCDGRDDLTGRITSPRHVSQARPRVPCWRGGDGGEVRRELPCKGAGGAKRLAVITCAATPVPTAAVTAADVYSTPVVRIGVIIYRKGTDHSMAAELCSIGTGKRGRRLAWAAGLHGRAGAYPLAVHVAQPTIVRRPVPPRAVVEPVRHDSPLAA